MHRKLTITIDDAVYDGLHRRVGRGQISQFIEDLVRPHVVDVSALEAEYREAALDAEAEAEALEWIEWAPDEALD
ncbi:MAG: addiction module antitoxin [Chloroflexota bacterium]